LEEAFKQKIFLEKAAVEALVKEETNVKVAEEVKKVAKEIDTMKNKKMKIM